MLVSFLSSMPRLLPTLVFFLFALLVIKSLLEDVGGFGGETPVHLGTENTAASWDEGGGWLVLMGFPCLVLCKVQLIKK